MPARPPGPDPAALQVEVAKQEAEIERLRGALDKALDAQRGQAECFASLSAQAQHKEQVGAGGTGGGRGRCGWVRLSFFLSYPLWKEAWQPVLWHAAQNGPLERATKP